jgi:PAS domain S-box-containing protein
MQLENALAKSEERLSIIASLSYDVLWEWHIASDYHKWIGDIDSCLGYQKNEFPRTIKAWENIIHPDDRERVINNLNNHHIKKNKWHEKYRIIKKDGEIRWWNDRGVTRWDEDGTPLVMTGAIMDITSQVLHEKELSALQKRAQVNLHQNFLNMLEQLPVCFHLQANDHTVPFANKMFRERFGSPKSKKCYQLMHKRDVPCDPCPTFKVFDTAKVQSNVWTAPDNKTYLTVTTPFKGINGSDQIMEMSIDITKEHKADKLLIMSEKRFRAIFEESPLGVAMIDSLTGHIYEVNLKFADIAGRSLEEMGTIDWMSITHPDDIQEDLDNMAALNAGKINGFNMEKRYIKPDGSYVWINMTISPLIFEDTITRRHLCMIEDITEKKKAENTITRFGRLLNSSSNEIYSFDSKSLLFTQVNIGACKNLGYSIIELNHLTPLDIQPQFSLETFEKLIRPLKEKKESKLSFETIHKRKNGTTYQVNIHLQLVHEESPPLFLAIVEDITERKKTENALKNYQTHLEEEVNKRSLALKKSQERLIHSEKLSSLGKFAGTVAHEFNNPLFGVINLIEQMGGSLKEKERIKFSKLAKKECWRMADMIKNLQSFYKPSEDIFTLNCMNKILEEVLLVTENFCKNKGISVHKVYEAKTYSFEGIEDQIKQVLLNIIKNSIDSITNNKGKIIISISQTPSNLILEVKDTGIGIKKENIKSIFDPFYTTKGKEGTGLGLSVSYGIIKSHGGDIKIKSKSTKGSTVTLVLPIKKNI